MEIKKSTWHAKQICPDCGQGNPIFCYCIKCGFVTLMCEETGDTFKNPRDLNGGFTDKCPNCGQESATAFELADSARIINSGFTREDYE